MDFQDILFSGGLIGFLILFLIGLWFLMLLLIPFLLLGIYRQTQETSRLLTVLAKRGRTGEDNAIVERLDQLVTAASNHSSSTLP